jgi:diguanylate cyclase (GGDEF)-like protein
MSASFAVFSFTQSSRGLDRIVALSDGRKTARETLVALLDQQTAFRFFAAENNQHSADAYHKANAREERFHGILRGAVGLLDGPKISATMRDFEAASTRLAGPFDRPQLAGNRSGLPGARQAEADRGRRSLEVLIDAFNAAGKETVEVTKRRILIAGLVSLVWTIVFGTAALVMERVRRRIQRDQQIEQTIIEREKVNLAVTRADIMQAGKAALEHEMGERRQVEQQLAFAAFHDELTGLANRALLMTRLDRIVAKTYAGVHLWAILFLDLDRFKVINDSLGHALGDLVLIETARRLERCLRSGDTLARLGGDEFIILLDGIEDVAAASEVAQRLLRTLDAPFTLAGREVFASASIGIAASRNSDDRPEDILRNADIAMYRAKHLGKHRYELFSPELLAGAVLRLELETDLAHALERREFCLFYQPLISMRDECLIGFEALVRWQHPRRGLIDPDHFITIAEDNGAIIPLGDWILHEACRQLKEWQLTLPGAADLRINVNVSGKQLASPDFIATVESALATSGLRAESVNMEITETVLMHNAEESRETLTRIRKLGIQIHLDDFGTGYSSLSYLRHFPIDSLKIDRSFVSTAKDDMTAGLASAEIVRTIIDLAQSLSLSVTAEGAETAAQVEALRDLGCTNVQGFHFSRPVEALAAATMILSSTTLGAASSRLDPLAGR